MSIQMCMTCQNKLVITKMIFQIIPQSVWEFTTTGYLEKELLL